MRLYRANGWAAEADATERELRDLMVLAEPGFWLVQQLDAGG